MSKFIKTALFGAMAGVMAFGAMAEETINPEVKDTPVVEEATVSDPEVTDAVVEEPVVEQKEIIKESNPKIAFPHGLQLGVGLSGTTGLNGFIGYNNKKFDSFWWKRLGFRADFATMSPLKSKIKSTIKSYVGKEGIELSDSEEEDSAGLYLNNFALNSHHFAALLDIYPFGDTWFLGGWRLTGGYFFGQTKFTADLTGKLNGAPDEELTFEFDGTEYKYIGNTVKGKAKLKWDFSGPYAGTGFDLGLFCGFKIYFDAGVVFTSKAAELDFDINPNNLQIWDTGLNDWKPIVDFADYNDKVREFHEAKDAELKDVNDEFNKYKFYPVVKLGFMYRF
ncbi:MAG: hypothetical protein K6B71_04075 [Alphaproteobacteria bacterium]|nr:hypothetical protein [Alphaproteobacteria bacterium]